MVQQFCATLVAHSLQGTQCQYVRSPQLSLYMFCVVLTCYELFLPQGKSVLPSSPRCFQSTVMQGQECTHSTAFCAQNLACRLSKHFPPCCNILLAAVLSAPQLLSVSHQLFPSGTEKPNTSVKTKLANVQKVAGICERISVLKKEDA